MLDFTRSIYIMQKLMLHVLFGPRPLYSINNGTELSSPLFSLIQLVCEDLQI